MVVGFCVPRCDSGTKGHQKVMRKKRLRFCSVRIAPQETWHQTFLFVLPSLSKHFVNIQALRVKLYCRFFTVKLQIPYESRKFENGSFNFSSSLFSPRIWVFKSPCCQQKCTSFSQRRPFHRVSVRPSHCSNNRLQWKIYLPSPRRFSMVASHAI